MELAEKYCAIYGKKKYQSVKVSEYQSFDPVTL
jgi:hypothetical protein